MKKAISKINPFRYAKKLHIGYIWLIAVLLLLVVGVICSGAKVYKYSPILSVVSYSLAAISLIAIIIMIVRKTSDMKIQSELDKYILVLNEHKDDQEWLHKELTYVNLSDEIIAEMKNIISTNQIETRNVFDELFNKVCNALSEDSDSDYIHTLSNMALLTKNDNAALNNSTFDVKRNQIVSMDQRGAFIPYCTKMVFLKYYTPSRENQIHFWGQKDRIAYIKAMENIIQPYLTIINKTF